MKEPPDNLQTTIRRLQVWNAVLLCSIIALSAVVIKNYSTEANVIRARSVQLVSTDGAVLAEFATVDGNPGLYLKDRNGVNRAALFHANDDTGLYIMDADGVTRIGIAQFAHGGGGVALHGPESKGAAVLYFKNEGSLRFFDPEGVVTNQVTAQESEAKD